MFVISIRPFVFLISIIYIFLVCNENVYSNILEQPCSFIAPTSSDYKIRCDNEYTAAKQVREIDNFFNDNYKSVTSLSITESLIDDIPRIICKMINLKFLDLSNNNIQEIPANCLINLYNISELNLSNNKISTLNNGILDNLIFLRILKLDDNKINNIGIRTFSKESNLKKLKYISLSNNRIFEVDSWPFNRGQAVNNSYINLKDNLIETFTNKRNWSFDCDEVRGLNLTINLENNRIKHVFDVWQMFSNPLAETLCFGTNNRSKLRIILGRNPIICDCFEFTAFILFHYNKGDMDSLTDIFCVSNNGKIIGKKYKSLILDELVCEVPCGDNCKCFQHPLNASFRVQCSNSLLTSLPESLPPRNKPYKMSSKYAIDFSLNPIKNLSSPSYLFKKTKYLNMSHCNLTEITDQFWLAIKNIPYVSLNNNEIRVLPKSVIKEPGDFKEIILTRNPLSCDCTNKWMQGWIRERNDRILDAEAILCETPHWLKGRSILTIQDFEFCNDPAEATRKIISWFAISIVVIIAIAILILAVLLILYRFRLRLFIEYKIHPFEKDECENEMMLYDAFLCSTNEDISQAKNILQFLEKSNYNICFHERDFMVGSKISDNIISAVNQSKRCIFLVSTNFIKSSHCCMEFDVARSRDMILKKHRVVVWLMSELDEIIANQEPISANIISYINTHTYIDYKKLEWEKACERLLYVMPVKSCRDKTNAISNNYDLIEINDI